MKKTKKHCFHLQSVIFCAFFSVCAVVLLLFSIVFYRYVSNILMAQETDALIDQNASLNAQTENIVGTMDQVAIDLDYSEAVEKLLGSAPVDLYAISLSDFTALCTSINGTEDTAHQINFYDYKGNVLQVGAVTKHAFYDTGEAGFLKELEAASGCRVISAPYQSHDLTRYISDNDWYISIYRYFYDDSGVRCGVIETVRTCKSIFKPISSYASRKSTTSVTYVYDGDGRLIYPYKDVSGTELPYYSLLKDQNSGFQYRDPDSGETEVIVFSTASDTGWTYITVQPAEVILAPVASMRRLLIFVVLLLMMVSALLAYMISRSLVRPIHMLQNEIRATQISTLGQTSEENLSRFMEIAQLEESFSKMSRSLKTSMDELLETRKQEQRSRVLALQSQINPHFYYNSLASVIALAENDQNEEVIRMCMNLTRIMRYITNTEELVTVGEEIDYIKKYLYCMKIRYQSSLNYMIDIDPRLEEQVIPRLLIQPIVENALKYGIHSEPPWGLAIHGRYLEDSWVIEIRDKGPGFSDEALETIRRRIAEAEQQIGMPQTQISGMGTLNVYLRWKLFCGDQMIFRLENSPTGGHAIVTIGRYFTDNH